MISFALLEQNLPFAVALALMGLVALVEGVSMVLGGGLSGFLDSLMPDTDLDIDLDMDGGLDGAELGASSPLVAFLGWLQIGKVPFLILLVVFLTAFGLGGLGIQAVCHAYFQLLLPWLPASAAAFALALLSVRFFGGILARILPKDETEAVSEKSFVGLVATITVGRARRGSPAQGKVKDPFGQTHYVMIEPAEESDVFEQDSKVLLVDRQGATFTAIESPIE